LPPVNSKSLRLTRLFELDGQYYFHLFLGYRYAHLISGAASNTMPSPFEMLGLFERSDVMLGRLAVLAIITCTAAGIIPVHAADGGGHELFRVDLGCPREATTFKEGWTRWWINGGCEGDALGSLLFKNIADSGIDAMLVPVGGTANLRAGAGDPIANTTFSWQHPRERFGPRYMHSDELEPVARQFGLCIELK
jgi:hypothetical protein